MNENNPRGLTASNNEIGSSDYKIESVQVTSNGRNELCFEVDWSGNTDIDYYELRILDTARNCLEVVAYASQNQKVIIKDFYMDLESKTVNAMTFYVELGIADYTEDGETKSWKLLAAYAPIHINLYYRSRLFGMNILEIR